MRRAPLVRPPPHTRVSPSIGGVLEPRARPLARASKYSFSCFSADGEPAGADSVDAGASAGAAPAHAPGTGLSALAEGETEESYDEMLARVFTLLHENNPELMGRERRKLKPPQVSRVGTTRTAWTNFKDICK